MNMLENVKGNTIKRNRNNFIVTHNVEDQNSKPTMN